MARLKGVVVAGSPLRLALNFFAIIRCRCAVAGMILLPPALSAERHELHVRVHEAEGLPHLDTFGKIRYAFRRWPLVGDG